MSNKDSLRQKFKAIRDAIKNKDILEKKIQCNLLEFIRKNYPNNTIAAYYPIQSEIDILSAFINLNTANLVLPEVIQKDAPLQFRQYNFKDLKKDILKIPTATGTVIKPDLVLVPLLAFDEYGTRLGYGGGYYDRTFARLNCIKIGIVYAIQQHPKLPKESYDQTLDYICTEKEIITSKS